MPKYCVPRKFETEEQQSLDEGSEKHINPNGKYQTLLGFTDMRERYMGASHESSVRLLYGMNNSLIIFAWITGEAFGC